MFENPGPDQRCALLKQVRTIAVIGLSPKPERPSHRVAKAMQRFGFKIIPVRPAVTKVLGEKAYPTLADVTDKIDLVNVFRAAGYIDGIVDDCLQLGLKHLWIQSGIVNESAAMRARENGITVVMDRCIMVDYSSYCL
jgi:predicted CoA-binding protein